jgi:hypothetical protein
MKCEGMYSKAIYRWTNRERVGVIKYVQSEKTENSAELLEYNVASSGAATGNN